MDSLNDYLSQVLTDFNVITKKPDRFLSIQHENAERSRTLVKNLYDFVKTSETKKITKDNTLPNLIIDHFDDEQVWQELELQNNAKYNDFLFQISHLMAKLGKTRDLESVDASHDENEDISGEEDEENDVVLNDESDNESNSEDSELKTEEIGKRVKKNFVKTVVDDKFFSLNEMDNYLDQLEAGKLEDSDNSVDYFKTVDSESEEEIKYSDFFDEPEQNQESSTTIKKTGKKTKIKENEELGSKTKSKKVQFALPGEESEASSTEEDKSNSAMKSTFELRQERLKSRIDNLEKEALKEKPWQLQGEVTGTSRPQNSLLEEFVEFDLSTRSAPVITEQTTLKLEDIIRQRIKDKSWDDVEKKIKPVEHPQEYKKKLVLDQEKSKISLAEIYEKEFIKQRDAVKEVNEGKVVEEEEPAEHIEIKNMMKELFSKLDALSNFHYTPKQITPELKIISNVPVISVEEIAPIATSDAALLAPEEIKVKTKGELIGKNERTVTDKKRERRKKKLKQREKKKDKEKKEKLIKKLNPGLGNKYSKQKASELLEKVTKDFNVNKMNEKMDSKMLKSSKQFFSQLQDEVSSQIKESSKGIKRKVKSVSITAKKVKL